MYCSQCGKENGRDAMFCQRCGRAFEREEETLVAGRREAFADVRGGGPLEAGPAGEDAETPGERIFSVSPTLLFVKIGYAFAVAGAFLLVALASVLISAVSPLYVIPFALLLLLIPGYYHLRQRTVRYSLTDTTVEIDRGFVSRSTQNLPLRRVQDVTVSAGIMQRMLGIGDIVIDNASENGGKIVLANIDSPRKYADRLLAQMRRLDR